MSGQASPKKALRYFGLRQTLRGAVIIGLLGGLLMGAQGAAYAAAYPTQHSRDIFVSSLSSVAGLGFLSGETKDAATPASYAIYKSITIMTLLTAVWGLVTTTRLLRGQEDDGTFEQILAGNVTKTMASVSIIIGYAYSFVASALITWLVVGLLGRDHSVNLSFGAAGLLTIAVYLPGLFFTTLGIVTSQLALTRERAFAYGIAILLFFFALRGIGNSVSDWNDLKEYTPFGWSDLLNPVLGADIGWIFPTIVFSLFALLFGFYFIRTRDLGESILPESEFSRSRFYLLGSDFGHTVRQNIWPFIWWALGTVVFAGIFASVAKIVVDKLTSSSAFVHIIGSFGSNDSNIIISFLSFSGTFTVLILLVMAAVIFGSMRSQEAKGYLDNILVQPVRRSGWLGRNIIVLIIMTTIISVLNGVVIWQFTHAENITLDLGFVIQNSLALIGTVILLIGIGTLLYGILPRAAAYSMYAIILWSFIVDIVKAFFSLGTTIDKTSLLHYVSFTLTRTPDWSTFCLLTASGIVLALIGVICFSRRDIITE